VCLTCWGSESRHSHFETAASRSRHRSIPRRDPPDEHGQWRPLLDRLSAPAIAPNVPAAEWGRGVFLLASKRQTPEYTGQQLPELNGYRAITAITPRGALCVVGNDPANQTIQIRHEDVTSVDCPAGWANPLEASCNPNPDERPDAQNPDGTDTDLEAAARYIRTAAYEERVPQASGSNAATSSRPVTGSLQLTPCWTQPRRGSNPLWTGASGTISIQRGRKPVWSSQRTPVSRETTGRYDSRIAHRGSATRQ